MITKTMMKNTKLLGIKEIVHEEEFYPRFGHSWQVAYDYAESMKTGARFPPITVAWFAGTYYLVDGKHRIEATKMNKQKSIEAEVLNMKTRKDIFLEAVKRNIAHGKALSVGEKAQAVLRLRKEGINDIAISKIVQVPIGKMKRFTADRIASTITGETIVLKPPLKHLAGQTIDDNLVRSQEIYCGNNQEKIVEEMLTLLETGSFNVKNLHLVNQLKKIRQLIGKLIMDTRQR